MQGKKSTEVSRYRYLMYSDQRNPEINGTGKCVKLPNSIAKIFRY